MIQDKEAVRKQYQDSSKLNIRIALHQNYSVNKQGFGNWIFEQYEFKEKFRILELGCGNATMWKEHIHQLPKQTALYLTDVSEGMLYAAKENIEEKDGVFFKIVDIQNIPFDTSSFDVVIANMMLYHVPELKKGLSEVRRVLKEEGCFYCATYGEHGIAEYLQELLRKYGIKSDQNKAFTLQNGAEILKDYFSAVGRRMYEDHLEISKIEDLIEYISSLTFMVDWNKIPKEELRAILENRKRDGKLYIPKEYGMFIARKN